MAEEMVAMEFLSDSMISAGRKLFERLDGSRKWYALRLSGPARENNRWQMWLVTI